MAWDRREPPPTLRHFIRATLDILIVELALRTRPNPKGWHVGTRAEIWLVFGPDVWPDSGFKGTGDSRWDERVRRRGRIHPDDWFI